MKQIIDYFTPDEDIGLFNKQKSTSFIVIVLVGILMSLLFAIQNFNLKSDNFSVTISSIILIDLFLIVLLFVLKKKGIKFSGNLLSIGGLIMLLISINILKPEVSSFFKYIQGFYTVFAFAVIGVLFATKRVIIFNTIMILATTTRVFLFAIKQLPEQIDLLKIGYASHTVSLLVITMVLYYAVKHAEKAITEITKNGEIKEKQNQKLIIAENKAKKAEQEILVKNNKLEAREKEIRASYEDLYTINNKLSITNKKLEKAKEKAEEANRIKTAFLASISHEIKTPLNAIIGFTNIIAEESKDPKHTEFCKIVDRQNELLLKLINDVLDSSKLEAGIFEIKSQEVNLNKLIDEIYNVFMLKCPKNITLVTRKLKTEMIIMNDEVRLFQIFINLISNSIKFTESGQIEFGFELINKSSIVGFVIDTGIGIAEDKQNVIFNKFTKLNEFSQGTGLGLSIVKSIVELLGGKIWLESEINKGSSFYFEIPFSLKK